MNYLDEFNLIIEDVSKVLGKPIDKAAQSTLAASILADKNMKNKGINDKNVGEWIKHNCRRIDVLLDASLGIFALELVEAALHYKYEPTYEGFITQR